MATATEFTTSPYERSHGKAPRGNGSWAFQRSTTRVAFAGDLYGEVEFYNGTLTEAKKQARKNMLTDFVAVLG